jgi:hypothetical protein
VIYLGVCRDPQPRRIAITPFDGRNWERHAAELAHLNSES